MRGLRLKKTDDGVLFTVKVVPGSSRTAICGLLGEMLKVKVAAPPEKGKANQCLIGHLAKELGLKKDDVRVISGHVRAVKDIQVCGLGAEALLEKLGLKGK